MLSREEMNLASSFQNEVLPCHVGTKCNVSLICRSIMGLPAFFPLETQFSPQVIEYLV